MKGELVYLDREAGATAVSSQDGSNGSALNEAPPDTALLSGWRVGRSIASGRRGHFPLDFVYILPTLSEPPKEILVCILHYVHLWILYTLQYISTLVLNVLYSVCSVQYSTMMSVLRTHKLLFGGSDLFLHNHKYAHEGANQLSKILFTCAYFVSCVDDWFCV